MRFHKSHAACITAGLLAFGGLIALPSGPAGAACPKRVLILKPSPGQIIGTRLGEWKFRVPGLPWKAFSQRIVSMSPSVCSKQLGGQRQDCAFDYVPASSCDKEREFLLVFECRSASVGRYFVHYQFQTRQNVQLEVGCTAR